MLYQAEPRPDKPTLIFHLGVIVNPKSKFLNVQFLAAAYFHQADSVHNLDYAFVILNPLELTQNIHLANKKVGKKLHINVK